MTLAETTGASVTPVRVRFAPSPTGHLHVGGARTALFNWLFARHHGGRFIVRVEDTDQARSTLESEAMVLSDLQWLGLQWDEGPDVGGPDGPYRQSERRDSYRSVADELVRRGVAYPCFCSEEELEVKRRDAEAASRPPHYDLTCFNLSGDERQRRLSAGHACAIRFHVPKESGGPFDADVTIDDLIRGPVTWGRESLGDFILIRSDGMPTYNFSVVADDHAMEISHVIRAEEHLTNTHRQVLIYRAMEWEVPSFAHVSLILGPDRTKLSKRHGATSVSTYAEEGYLPEALMNYLTLLGWSSPSGAEIFTMEKAAAEFSLDRVNAAPAVFDLQKLNWMNGEYLRAMPPERAAALSLPWFQKAGFVVAYSEDARRWLEDAVDLVTTAAHRLADLPGLLEFVFLYDAAAVVGNPEYAALLADPSTLAVFETLERELAAGTPRTPDDYPPFVERLKAASGQKGKKLFMPLRLALTGMLHGPELHRSLPLIERGSTAVGLAPIVSPFIRVKWLREALRR
jgi:nondiscriminating glutamyl-tRNA synthetase